MARRPKLLLGELLVKSGKITEDDLENALDIQSRTGKPLGTALVEMGAVRENDLIEFLSQQIRVPSLNLEDYSIDLDALKFLDADKARKFKVMPLFVLNDVLTIGMSDPSDVMTIDEITRITMLDVEPVLCTYSAIERAIDTYYGSQDIIVEKDRVTAKDVAAELEQIGAVADEEDVSMIELVDKLIDQAIKTRASDIHIEPKETTIRIRYRVDGILEEIYNPPKRLQSALISRIKIMAGLDIAEARKPQDGRIQHSLEGKQVDLRISTYPAYYGEKIVIRVLDVEKAKISLTALGFTDEVFNKYREIVDEPNGIVLATGPTGSGKTTTLYATINEINDVSKNIITIEDPIEYQLSDVNQGQVNIKAGVTFTTALRSILRQDPDIIMVGEIRDRETAALAIQAALTGHLVFSTVHTNDAAGAITRLVNMGVEEFLVASTIRGVVAQRLIRLLCNECAKRYRPSEDEIRSLGIPISDDIVFRKPVGCMSCRRTGYRGRMGLYELLVPDAEIVNMILKGASSVEIKKAAVRKGMKTLRMQGLEKVMRGLTSLEEALIITASEEMGGMDEEEVMPAVHTETREEKLPGESIDEDERVKRILLQHQTLIQTNR